MYIWPDGSVTGSVNHAVLEAYLTAKDAGEDLSEFASYLGVPPDHPLWAEAGAAEQSAAPAEVDDSGESYDEWSLADLQSEAEARGLPKYGTKAEIAARLYDNDAGGETPADPEEE